MAEYNGKSSRLIGLADSNISEEAFRLIRAIGVDRCKRLIDEGTLKLFIWDEIMSWMGEAPSHITDELRSLVNKEIETFGEHAIFADWFLFGHYVVDGEDEAQARLAALVFGFTGEEFERLICKDTHWFDGASGVVRGIIEMMCGYDPPNALAPESFGGLIDSLIKEIVDDGYLIGL